MNKIKTIIRAVALIAVVSASTGCLDNFASLTAYFINI